MQTSSTGSGPLSTETARHLAALFPGYVGSLRELLATLTEGDLKHAFRQATLDSHPDRVRSADPLIQGLGRDRFEQGARAFDALSERIVPRDAASPSVDALPATEIATPRIIAVGGAKGGVGKSTIAASLATALAMLGHRVTAVDLDLGGANLHLFLGMRSPERTLADFWRDPLAELSDVVRPTPIANLSLVAGDSSALGAANIAHGQKQRLVRQIARLTADWIVLDLGGDMTFNTLDFFLEADERLVVTTEDPAALLDAYNFVKVVLLRTVAQWAIGARQRPTFGPETEARLERFVDGTGHPGAASLPTLLADLGTLDPAAAAAVDAVVEDFHPRLVLNLAGDGSRGVLTRVQEVCRQHLRIEADLCHLVPADALVSAATRRLTNVLGAELEGEGSRAIWAIAHKMVHADDQKNRRRPGRPALRTRFFQPPWLFPLLPRVLGDRGRRLIAARRPFQAWYLGAGTGEGAYSLAAALDDALGPEQRIPYQVWASGSSESAVEHAQRAVYPLVFASGLRPETLKRFFLRGTGLQAGLCTVKAAIRERVTFVPGGDLEAADELPPIDLAFVGLDAEAFAIAARGPLGETLAERVAPSGLLLAPSWPRRQLPLAGFDYLDTGIFVRSGQDSARFA